MVRHQGQPLALIATSGFTSNAKTSRRHGALPADGPDWVLSNRCRAPETLHLNSQLKAGNGSAEHMRVPADPGFSFTQQV